MAGGWHVRLERELAGVEIDAELGKAILYYHHQIDELAERLELPALSSYFSSDPEAVSAYLAKQGLDAAAFDLPDEVWFEPASGLETIRGLLDAIRADATGIPESDKVLADLVSIERALQIAVLHSVRFHLARNLTVPE
jgi:hypothetical protein